MMIHDRYKKKGLAIGPLEFPMKDEAARMLEAALKQAEKEGFSYKRNFVTRLDLEVGKGERTDVSTITTTDVDRDNEIVLASGADTTQFTANPVVTFGHKYDMPPVGRAQWLKFYPTPKTATSIKAKTEYAPEGLYDLADTTWNLVKAGFLVGKSIGFLPTEAGPPTQKEVDASEGKWAGAKRVIRKWQMFEYAVATVPANGNALVEAVAKGELLLPDYMMKALGLELPEENTIITDVWEWGEPEYPQPKYAKAFKETQAELLRAVTSSTDLLKIVSGKL